MDRVIVLDVNEVPNRVLDAYARTSPFFASFLEASDRYETVAADLLQLDPWIAWPSFYRGVNDERHGLLRLGQDTTAADRDFPPLWRMLRDHGVSAGVYGSLYSSSETDQSGYAFFVPDVFSPHSRVVPEDLSRFQAFNLEMTRASARNADEGVAAGGKAAVIDLALRRRLELGTIGRVAGQLVDEKLDRKKLSRRRNTQTELHADVFCSLVEDKRPQFSSFYTNNVAAAMHRFWSAAFQEGSINRGRLSQQWADDYADEVFAALRSVERLVRRLVRNRSDAIIVLASALGQEEIPAENYRKFLTIGDVTRFVKALLPERENAAFESLPTMVPDFTLRFRDKADLDVLIERMARLTIGDMQAVETLERMLSKELVGDGTPLAHIRHAYSGELHFKHPVTFARSDDRTLHISVQADDYDGPQEVRLGNQTFSFEELGLRFVHHDEGVNCTAQHCAEGSLVVNRPSGRRESELKVVSALDFAPSVLAHFRLERPAHLMGKPSIALG